MREEPVRIVKKSTRTLRTVVRSPELISLSKKGLNSRSRYLAPN